MQREVFDNTASRGVGQESMDNFVFWIIRIRARSQLHDILVALSVGECHAKANGPCRHIFVLVDHALHKLFAKKAAREVTTCLLPLQIIPQSRTHPASPGTSLRACS